MHAIDLHDDLELTRLPEGQPSRHLIRWAPDAPQPSPIDWPLEKDLAVRAHRLLEQHTGRPLPISLILSKRIPVGGGLGGGSSDAAATMLALNRLFELGLPLSQLRDLARTLGSDIAYFIDDASPPRPAIVTGLGDRIERIPASVAAALLIIPPFGCPTGPVYKAFDALPVKPIRVTDIRALPASNPAAAPLFNDLLPAAQSVQPALGPLRHRIAAAAGLPVHMSGSGSTLFILARDHAPLPALAEKIHSTVPEVALVPVRLA